jgi:uncharacterized protein YdhG (YjbR/CyaY superfamily)
MKPVKSKLPASIDAYIEGMPDEVQSTLLKIRDVIARAAPGAEQSISYRIPTFKLAGRPLLYFASFKAHIGLYPIKASVKLAFKKELARYAQSKGTVRFPLDRPVPYPLIGRIAKFRVKEIAGVGKGKITPAGKPRASKRLATRRKKA